MTSPIDPEVFAQLEDLEDPDDPGFVDEMLDMYTTETPEVITSITDALAQDDANGVHALAHKLKSTSGLIGAMTLSGIAERIETAGRLQQLDGVSVMLIDLEVEYLRVCDYFEETNGRQTALAA